MLKKISLIIISIIFLIIATAGATAQSFDTNRIIAYWGGDISTGIMNDSSGNGYHLVNHSVGAGTGCIINECFEMDGTNSWLNTTGTIPISNTSISISYWINRDANANSDQEWAYDNSAGNKRIDHQYISGNHRIYTRDPVLDTGNTGVSATTGQWDYMVFTQNSAGAFKIYVNGTLSYTSSNLNTFSSFSPNSFIWCNYRVPGYECDGTMDEMMLVEGELSSQEINDTRDNYYLGISPLYSSPTTFLDISISSTNTFNATINNTLWTTTNGTINTNYNQSMPFLTNITINAENYFSKTYTNYNTSTDISTTLAKYPEINAYNQWNNSGINNFNITIDSITYTTTNGDIFVGINTTKNVTFNSENYITLTKQLNLQNDQIFNGTIYQTISNIKSKDIFNNNSIINFTIKIDTYNLSTTNGTITINPNAEAYYVNFSALQFHNSNNILLNYTAFATQTKNYTIINLHTAEFNFRNNISNTSINTTCEYLGFTEINDKFSTYNQTNTTMDCYEFGYINRSVDISGNKYNSTIYMQPVRLMITFSEQTSGYIAWEGEVNGSNGYSFNDTSVILGQDEIGIGYVSIVFNSGQQVYEYYNDGNTHINQYLFVQDPDVIQPMKLWDGIQYITGKIDVYQLNNITFNKIFSIYTNEEGEANVLLESGNVFKFVGTSTGYSSATLIEYIPPTTETTNTNIIILELTETTDATQKFTYNNSCANLVEEPTNCIITATSNVNTYNFQFVHMLNWTNITTNYADSTSGSIIITANGTNSNNGTIPIWIYANGDLINVMKIKYQQLENLDIQIGFAESNRSWILANKTNTILFIVISLIVSIIIGALLDQLFEGMGVKAGVLALMLITAQILPVMYAIGLLFSIWIFYDWRKN